MAIAWAGNERERRVKARGWGIYASHIGEVSNDGGTANVYMYRFILLLPFGFTLRLHHIMRSDADRHLHDHPFDFTSFLMSGGYVETSPDYDVPFTWSTKQRIYPRFSLVRKRAEDLHSLRLERPVWTLVLAGPKRRDWGFQTEKGWILNHRYFEAFPREASWRDVPARDAVTP